MIGVSVGVGVAVTEGIDHWKTIYHAGKSVVDEIVDAPSNFVNSFAHSLEEIP